MSQQALLGRHPDRRGSFSLDQPATRRQRGSRKAGADTFGKFAERFAQAMGTPQFLLGMTILIVVWISWNIIAPESLRFDPPWFILLNLLFSTQASYAAPLILLAQRRQDDRDRVAIEADRQRDERNLADTEFLTREVASLRLAVQELGSREFIRSEMRDMLKRQMVLIEAAIREQEADRPAPSSRQ